MRSSILLLLLSPFLLQAQTFTGTGGSIPGTGSSQTCFPLTVIGVGNIGTSNGLSQVCFTITHPVTDELEILLQAPNGTYVPLSIQNGTGANYTSTCFTATATTPIKFSASPFTGTFLPEGHLGAVNNGQSANGIWRLCILDRRNGTNAGSLVSWSLTFSNNPAPQPPALPTCSSSIPSTSNCASAVSICDFNGACGSTVNTPKQSWPALDAASCFGLNNNTFVKFVAAASTVSFSVWVPVSANGFNNINGGIQMLFFGGSCGGAVTTYGCYNRIYPYSAPGQPLISVVYASGLTPGNTYYLLIDGANGDFCDFTLAANSGVNILDIKPTAPEICEGSNVNLTASGGNGIYSWSPAAGLSATSGTTVTATPTSIGSNKYTVTSSTALGCPTSKDVTITVYPLPTAPVASVTAQPNCSISTGSITISSPLGASWEYSINGTNFQSNPLYNNVAPGTYTVWVRDAASGCTVGGNSVIIQPAPTVPPAPTVAITVQPSCNSNVATLSISAPIGNDFTYSLGGAYQNSPVFTNVAPGTYSISVKNNAGCISAATLITVNPALPFPAAPLLTTTQPNCNTGFGSITITGPIGTNFEYSIGGLFQSNPSFSNLAPGTYAVVVKDLPTGCSSAPVPVVINTIPSPPTAPTLNATQPDCNISRGSIVITAPLGNTFEYSIGGSFQSGIQFTNLPPGSYNVIVRNINTACISAATAVVINTPPLPPAAPQVSVVTLPGCDGTTGSISFTAPIGNSFEYGLNGNYQSAPLFTNLQPGTYNATVRNTGTACISAVVPILVATPNCTNDLFVPNAFSPNGDGKNDLLFVRGTQIRSLQFILFNQWGEKVFETTQQNAGWDGRVNGKAQPVGVYVYALKAILADGTVIQKKGSVTLIR